MYASRRNLIATVAAGVALASACGSSHKPSEEPREEPEQRRLMIDDDAPLGSVQDAEGNQVEIGSILRGNLTVLVFYRGDW